MPTKSLPGIGFLLVATSLIVSCSSPGLLKPPPPPDYWPTQAWRRSTPEAQGMDSGKLIALGEAIIRRQRQNPAGGTIDSLTVIRNGYVVAEFYPNRHFPRNTLHVIHSCTKSIVSTLIGIAIARGEIKSVETPLLSFFPEFSKEKMDPRKKAMTIKDLLTMRTGLDSRDSFLFRWEGLFRLQRSENWTAHALGLPMVVAPGRRFDYSNISSFLLAAVLRRATGRDTLAYAREHLFAPLGIKAVRWEKSPEGVQIGWARMWLRPNDMARIGLLYLQRGRWGGKQIVPEGWVTESLRAHADPGAYRVFRNKDGSTNHKLSTGYWVFANLFRPFSGGYGYQWWLDKDGVFTALGHQGQFIMVAPRANIVMAVTARLQGRDNFLPAVYLKEFVLPAVVSSRPLPAASAKLRRKLRSLARSIPAGKVARKFSGHPPIALRVSGKTFALEKNHWQHDRLQVFFRPDSTTAEIRYRRRGQPRRLLVGLDGRYRRTRNGLDVSLARGRWLGQDRFELIHEDVGYSVVNRWVLVFPDPGKVAVTEVGVTGKTSYVGRAMR